MLGQSNPYDIGFGGLIKGINQQKTKRNKQGHQQRNHTQEIEKKRLLTITRPRKTIPFD